MSTELEIAGMLYHVANHPEEFQVEEVTEILKEAAHIICSRFGIPTMDAAVDLDELDPSGHG
jgi:hypothetical protein